MSNYDVHYLEKRAKEYGFVRDTFEKVIRLMDILEYFNTALILKNSLALKGGTAINLTIFNLPRLSVDIDLDYIITNSKTEMLKSRERINRTIEHYMISQGYTKNPKTKTPHSLDSWVYDYIGVSQNRDNIKIEINYSLRAHVLKTEDRPIITPLYSLPLRIQTLSPLEIYGSKLNALLNRAAARDLYDAHNMIRENLFRGLDKQMLKKCVIFYAALSARDRNSVNKTFDTRSIDSIKPMKIKLILNQSSKGMMILILMQQKNLLKNTSLT